MIWQSSDRISFPCVCECVCGVCPRVRVCVCGGGRRGRGEVGRVLERESVCSCLSVANQDLEKKQKKQESVV